MIEKFSIFDNAQLTCKFFNFRILNFFNWKYSQKEKLITIDPINSKITQFQPTSKRSSTVPHLSRQFITVSDLTAAASGHLYRSRAAERPIFRQFSDCLNNNNGGVIASNYSARVRVGRRHSNYARRCRNDSSRSVQFVTDVVGLFLRSYSISEGVANVRFGCRCVFRMYAGNK